MNLNNTIDFKINKSESKLIEWGEIKPLNLKSENNGSEYPIKAFPPIVRQAIIQAAFYNHVPLALSGQTALGIMVYIAQKHIQAPSDKSKSGQPCSFGLFTIFESGGGKDETRALLGKSIIELEDSLLKQFVDDIKDYKARSKENSKQISYPENPQTIFEKTTTQGIIKLMSKSYQTSFAWQTTEGAMIIGGYSLTSETQGESLGIINNLIDKGSTSCVLKGTEEPEFVIDKRFSIDLSIQNIMASKTLHNEVFRHQGFLARFLFAAPTPLPMKKITLQDRLIRADEDEKIIAFNNICSDLHVSNSKINFVGLGERFLFLKSNEAHVLHIAFENYINECCIENGKYHSIKPYAKRSIQYCLRVAAVLAYFHKDLNEIDEKTMQSAIDICTFSLEEWIRYYAKDEKTDSQILLDWLLKQNSNIVFKSSILTNATPKHLRKKALRDAALQHLIDCNYVAITHIDKKECVILNPQLTC